MKNTFGRQTIAGRRLRVMLSGVLLAAVLMLGVGCSAPAQLQGGQEGESKLIADDAANWSPPVSNNDFHLVLDSAYRADDAHLAKSAAPFAVPNSEEGIAFVGINGDLARFRANLACEGGDISEVVFGLGDIPDVGFVAVGAPFDGKNSAEQEMWGQPYFPNSTMVVYQRMNAAEVSPDSMRLDVLVRVPDEASAADEASQALAAAKYLETVTLSVEGLFAGGGTVSHDYRMAVAEGFDAAVRAQLAGTNEEAPLFTLQRLAADDTPDTSCSNSWAATRQRDVEEFKANRDA